MLTERILIIGGTGFIGRNFLNLCIERGFSCTVISLNNVEKNTQKKNVKYLTSDLADANSISKVLKSCRPFHYVVNLSGYIDHISFFGGGKNIIETHFVGVINLLMGLDRSLLKCFVQVGSSDEYGNLAPPQCETYRESPISPYSFSKLALTNLFQMLERTESFPAVVLRLFLVYGDGQDEQRFIPQVIKACLNNKEFPVSKGEQLRDFCHVQDIARGILLAMQTKSAIGEVINLASGVPIEIKKMIQKVQAIIKGGSPLFGSFPYRSSENMALYADINKARKIINWHPSIGIDEGLNRTIKFYENQLKQS